jgi:hypothetical protein
MRSPFEDFNKTEKLKDKHGHGLGLSSYIELEQHISNFIFNENGDFLLRENKQRNRKVPRATISPQIRQEA